MEQYSTYEKAKIVRFSLLTNAAEFLIYKKEQDSDRIKRLESINENLNFLEKKYGPLKIDPTDLTKEEALELGFTSYKASDSLIMLIPLWLCPFLIKKFKAISITGESKIINLSKINLDTRFGRITWGITPKKT